jgi:hypothetical protein
VSSFAPPRQPVGPLVTVIIPTHNHAGTVDLAGRSVLGQSVRSLELVVIGDGATPQVRAAVTSLLSDDRVRFIDHPKSSSRAELVRHEVLAEATSPYVCYLGDDDIMLPDHLAVTLDRLHSVDFTHPLPVFVDGDGILRAHLTDLAEPRCRLWHQRSRRNAVSLTGVGHRLDAYFRLPIGWREAPPEVWSDHYMWQQWFAIPGFRYATGDRLTVLKFEAAARAGRTDRQRRAEIVDWLARSQEPGFGEWLADRAGDAIRRAAIDLRIAVDDQADQFARERAELVCELERAMERCQQLQEAERTANDRAEQATAAVEMIRATRAWRAVSRAYRVRDRLVRLAPLRPLARRSQAAVARREPPGSGT